MAQSSGKTFGILLFYSLLMFSLPFMAFYGTKSILKDYFNVTGFSQTAWSVFSSVVVVNSIAFSYVWRALTEHELPIETVNPDGHQESDGPISLVDKKDD